MLEETKFAVEPWGSWITAKSQLVNVALRYIHRRVQLEELVVPKVHGTVGEGNIAHDKDILMAVEVRIIRGPEGIYWRHAGENELSRRMNSAAVIRILRWSGV